MAFPCCLHLVPEAPSYTASGSGGLVILFIKVIYHPLPEDQGHIFTVQKPKIHNILAILAAMAKRLGQMGTV